MLVIADGQWANGELNLFNEVTIPRVAWGEEFTPTLRALESNGLLVKRSTARTIEFSFTSQALCYPELVEIYSKLRQPNYYLIYGPYALASTTTSIIIEPDVRAEKKLSYKESTQTLLPPFVIVPEKLPLYLPDDSSLYELSVTVFSVGMWNVTPTS